MKLYIFIYILLLVTNTMKNIKDFTSYINEELKKETYLSAAEKLKKKVI